MRVQRSQPLVPAQFRACRLDPSNPLQLDLILDPGDVRLHSGAIIDIANTLSDYLLTAIAIPIDQLWVNLSPFERNRTMSPQLRGTQMGLDLLEQDYVLKQLTSSLLYPESEPGKSYWAALYGSTSNEIQVPTIQTVNKVWITPQSANIAELGATAMIEGSALTVSTERDYIATQSTRT